MESSEYERPLGDFVSAMANEVPLCPIATQLPEAPPLLYELLRN